MDYISKDDAIDCVLSQYCASSDETEKALGNAIEEIKKRPAADVVERKKGKWVEVGGFATPGGDPVWCCSECLKGRHVWGIEHSTYGGDIADNQWVACPNCGADMREE